MDLQGWIDAYLDHLRVERALAKNSLDAYARDLNDLARHVGGERDPKGVSPDDIATERISSCRPDFPLDVRDRPCYYATTSPPAKGAKP